jgi:hypothetical protein
MVLGGVWSRPGKGVPSAGCVRGSRRASACRCPTTGSVGSGQHEGPPATTDDPSPRLTHSGGDRWLREQRTARDRRPAAHEARACRGEQAPGSDAPACPQLVPGAGRSRVASSAGLTTAGGSGWTCAAEGTGPALDLAGARPHLTRSRAPHRAAARPACQAASPVATELARAAAGGTGAGPPERSATTLGAVDPATY